MVVYIYKTTTYSIRVRKMSNLISYLSEQQLESKIQFIENYKQSTNPADGSTVDANANVTLKNISTLETEIMKDYMIQLNQKLMMLYIIIRIPFCFFYDIYKN